MERYILFLLLGCCLASCHEVPVGYLEAENAVYAPDSLVIRKEPDPVKDRVRINNEADWVSTRIQGILGTAPLIFSILDVRAEGEGADADAMKAVCRINGGGMFSIPLINDIPVGKYVMSIKISNDGNVYECREIFNIIVE